MFEIMEDFGLLGITFDHSHSSGAACPGEAINVGIDSQRARGNGSVPGAAYGFTGFIDRTFNPICPVAIQHV